MMVRCGDTIKRVKVANGSACGTKSWDDANLMTGPGEEAMVVGSASGNCGGVGGRGME